MATKIIRLLRNNIGMPAIIDDVEVPVVFNVGKPAVPNGSPVSEILFHRDGVVKGMESCYTIKFEGSDDVIALPQSVVIETTRSEVKTKKKNDDEGRGSIELPEEV